MFWYHLLGTDRRHISLKRLTRNLSFFQLQFLLFLSEVMDSRGFASIVKSAQMPSVLVEEV